MVEKIPFGDFAKLDMRVGEIKKVEDHPNADKLLVLTVDLGEGDERTIVAGLKGFYSAEDLVGKKTIFVANLEPVSLRGVESNGMILAGVSEDKSVVKILEIDNSMEVGTRIS
ncbi:MAG: methionine--tRNA ligase subunit beta [Nanoarchaeota archaeon]|nr:methionine--tRNA ligase subunit beta [Nanoarchaeota archaeon]